MREGAALRARWGTGRCETGDMDAGGSHVVGR